MKTPKPIALVDLDQTVAHLNRKWLGTYNIEYQDSVTDDHILSWNTGEYTKIGKEGMEEYLLRPGFFDDLEPIEGAIEGLTRLHNAGIRVIILSSPFGPDSARAKITWARNHLPFLTRKDIMLGHHKDLVYGDFLIDDSPKHLKNWTERWTHGIGMGIKFPWNDPVEGLPRVERYSNKDGQAWLRITDSIFSHLVNT